jgi:hypothetical protein
MDEERKGLEELAKKAMVSRYMGFQETMHNKHQSCQCQRGTLKPIII